MSEIISGNLIDAQKIRTVVDTWMKASKEGDLPTIMNLMTDDVVFLTPGNPPMLRHDFEAATKAVTSKMKIEGYPEIQEITVTGDLAICWNKLDIAITPVDGAPAVKRSGTTLSIFRRGEDGQWRIWRDANMLGPASKL